MSPEMKKRFVDFICERERTRIRKEKGKRPYTEDPIIGQYRFCNVQREHDRVTIWVRENWRTRWAEHPDLWFAMVVARLFNEPGTLFDLTRKSVLPFDGFAMQEVLSMRKQEDKRVFNAAYIVSTNGRAMDKAKYVTEVVLAPMWGIRKHYRPGDETLASYHKRLMEAQGMGSFMAAQVVADLKNTPECPLHEARDWWTWAAPGPGSLRGLNRMLGNPASKSGIRDDFFLQCLGDLRKHVLNTLNMNLHAQDIQNCLCEFDKYERARTGEGKPKQRYARAVPQA